MKHQKTWPSRSNGSPFTALPLSKRQFYPSKLHTKRQFYPSTTAAAATTTKSDYASIPYDLLTKISAGFSQRDLLAASMACKTWYDALSPLREAMLLLRWGKRFKHGKSGVKVNREKALELFLKGAARGSTLSMVDAGLVYWEMGRRDEGVKFYRRAAELGDPAGQCNLAIAYLQVCTKVDAVERMDKFQHSTQNMSGFHVWRLYYLS